jgi:hypothetical protein
MKIESPITRFNFNLRFPGNIAIVGSGIYHNGTGTVAADFVSSDKATEMLRVKVSYNTKKLSLLEEWNPEVEETNQFDFFSQMTVLGNGIGNRIVAGLLYDASSIARTRLVGDPTKASIKEHNRIVKEYADSKFPVQPKEEKATEKKENKKKTGERKKIGDHKPLAIDLPQRNQGNGPTALQQLPIPIGTTSKPKGVTRTDNKSGKVKKV